MHALILGGQKSGKSRAAKSRAADSRAAAWLKTPGDEALLIPTAIAGDHVLWLTSLLLPPEAR